MALERTYNVPLRREWLKVPKYKRAKRAVFALRRFLQKHMKSEDILIGKRLNEYVWQNGIRAPPHHVKINVVKEDDGKVYAELFGFKYEKPVKEEEKKKKPEEKKKEAEEKEEKPEGKKEEIKEKEEKLEKNVEKVKKEKAKKGEEKEKKIEKLEKTAEKAERKKEHKPKAAKKPREEKVQKQKVTS